MSKKSLLSGLKKIASSLPETPAIKEALSVLKNEINAIVEKKIESTGDYPIPEEIDGNPQAIAIFSDGACRGNPGPGAWGCFIQEHTGASLFAAKAYAEHTTNNKMELQGAIEGLLYTEENLPFKNEIFVYSDSKYVVDGMKSWVAGWKKRGWKKADKKTPENVEQWIELDRLRNELPNVSFHWVKGHAGHPQNEYCDQLANEALDENL